MTLVRRLSRRCTRHGINDRTDYRRYLMTSEAASAARPPLHVLRLDVDHPLPILDQLRLEEALLRGAKHNFLLFNRQSTALNHRPAVVNGHQRRRQGLADGSMSY